MNLQKLHIKNLYGYMTKEIDFNKDINLLVGINGSGKTSVLNVINWLLIPSISNLCVTEFEEIELLFSYRNEEYQLVCNQYEYTVTINLQNLSTEYLYPQISADLAIDPVEITKNNELREKYLSEYKGMAPEGDEVDTWSFLYDELPDPIVIGLDRNLYTEIGNDISYIENKQGRIRKSRNYKDDKKSTPLENVMQLASFEYMQYKNRILDLNKRLNDKIMLSSFDETLTKDNLYELLNAPKVPLKHVESLEVKVKNYFEENINQSKSNSKVRIQQQKESLEKIERYFSNLKMILNQVNDKDEEALDILYITNVNQFRKIRELIKEFEEFETKSSKYFESLNLYLETINIFLKDSSKQLYFDKKRSKLRYRILNGSGKVIEDNRDIDTLSSGEKQILILFTYIKFNNKLGKLFIIDEPELSLHPKWQESFLIGIKEIMPSNTQLLFATHSPSIVGKNKDYCKILLPY